MEEGMAIWSISNRKKKMTYKSKTLGDKTIVGYTTRTVPRHTVECKSKGEGCYLPGRFTYKKDSEGRKYRTKIHTVTEHILSEPIFEDESVSKV